MLRDQPRTFAIAAIALALLLAGCDTGDGKQLQPYDPNDYPAPTPSTEVESSFTIEQGAAADGALPRPSLIPALPGSVEGFTMTAPWQDGGQIDAANTCDGANIAPSVSWGGVPEGTVEIAIAMVDDSSISNGEPFVHWVVAGLDPAEIAVVEGDLPAGAVHGLNFFGDVGYGGPCPPPGDEAHSYRLTTYALNTPLQLADGTLATEFLEAIALATVRSTDLTGTYTR